MDWREFLEKDALDGKGANDKIKDPKWHDDPPVEEGHYKDIKITPKKFLRTARNASTPTRPEGSKDPLAQTEDSKKLTRRQVNDGKTTGLNDAHSNPEFDGSKPRKGQYDMRRGDELGAVEHYKYRLRHGGTVAKPTLDTDLKNNKVVGHEGRHRSRAAMEEGLKKIPTKLLNNRFDDENNKKRDLKGLKYEQDLTESSKELPKTSGKDTRHPMLGRKKSWESWLEKKNRTINDDFPKGNPPIKKKPTMFPRIIREFPDEKEDPMVYDNKTASWEDWLEKNNAIETSHKEDEKKHEWDGKFSSSTIRDDAKDEKAQSEEESLEELTDGKLEEIEKLKSWEAWLEKGRWDEPKSTATDTHLKEESGRDTRVEVNELNAEIGQEATNERLDEAGRTGMFKPTDTPNFTSKKPKYVKGVEQTGDDISQSKEHLNIDIAHAAKSWTIWLEKMQGAGDARFGNQHLTGLDQEPVNNEEDEANILPEKEEKTDDKREKHEETDDKPYKGLKAEKK